MPFRKSWHRRRRHSSYCSSITEIAVGGGNMGGGGRVVGSGAYASTSLSGRSGNTTATTSIGSASYAQSVGRNSVGSIDGLSVAIAGSSVGGASRRCSEQPQHFVVMDIINEDKVEV